MITPQEFSQKIKAKYPNATTSDGRRYADLDDIELTQKVIEKYPVYKSQVQLASSVPQQEKSGSFLGNLGKSLISPEIKLGESVAGAIQSFTGQNPVTSAIENQQSNQELLKMAHNQALAGESANRALNLAKTQSPPLPEVNKLVGKSPLQILGESGGVALDVATAGLGGALKGASGFMPLVKQAGGNILKGATTGYGFDVASGLEKGENIKEAIKPGLGALVGGAIPVGADIYNATRNLLKMGAPRFVNSLIKPLAKDLAYGKNPGKVIAEEGIMANSFEDLISKISISRKNIGQQIGNVLEKSANKNLDLSNSIKPIDEAISQAMKAPRTNASLVERLSSVKSDLLREITDETGNISIRELNNLTPKEAFEMKQIIGDITKFTGNASDDNVVNKALKQVYGEVKEKINTLDSGLPRLNEKYASLTSAEIAAKYRDKIIERSNIISMPMKIGGTVGLVGSVLTGGISAAPILAAIAAGALDKAASTTAFRTRIAAMLAKESKRTIQKIFNENPAVRAQIIKAFPRYKDY